MLTNTLPASVAFQSASTSQGALSVNGTMVVGSFGTVGIGAAVTNSILVTPQSFGTITNTATVTSGYTDPFPLNNSVILTTTVQPLPVLSARFASPNSVRLSWPVQLTNFVLEYKSALAPGALWSNDPATPVISGSEFIVIEPTTSVARFYRLKR